MKTRGKNVNAHVFLLWVQKYTLDSAWHSGLWAVMKSDGTDPKLIGYVQAIGCSENVQSIIKRATNWIVSDDNWRQVIRCKGKINRKIRVYSDFFYTSAVTRTVIAPMTFVEGQDWRWRRTANVSLRGKIRVSLPRSNWWWLSFFRCNMMQQKQGPWRQRTDEGYRPGADPEFAKGKGADHGERAVRAYNGSLGSEHLAGSRGRAPAGCQRGEAPLKPKAFCPFSYKRGAKR